MAEGYEDIENLTNRQSQMLDNSLQQQKDIINKQTEMNVAELERNKQEVDKDVDKTNKALYSEYKKASNPYGANAENLYSRGLGNSGYAETTQTNLYNTYQKNITDTWNNARDLKANFDNEIARARQTGDITLAQNALDIYNQKMQLLTQEYQLKNNREQFLYQKSQDALAQSNWEKEYARQQQRDAVSDRQWQQNFDYNKSIDDRNYNYQVGRDAITDNQWQQNFDYTKAINDRNYNYQKAIDDRNYNYQVGRDAVADNQWLKEYELSKKASATRSSRSSGSSSKSSTKNSNLTVDVSNNTTNNNSSKQESNAQALLQKSLETAEQISSKSGKDRFLKDVSSACQQAMQKGMINDEQMANIITQVTAKLGY